MPHFVNNVIGFLRFMIKTSKDNQEDEEKSEERNGKPNFKCERRLSYQVSGGSIIGTRSTY